MSSEREPEDGLGALPRVIASVIAGGGLVSGVGAVYFSRNEVGTVALLFVGGLFAYLAVSGQTLRRVKVGDNEAEFSRSALRVVMRTAEERTGVDEDGKKAAEIAAKILVEAALESPSLRAGGASRRDDGRGSAGRRDDRNE